jgi:hypothetical protein
VPSIVGIIPLGNMVRTAKSSQTMEPSLVKNRKSKGCTEFSKINSGTYLKKPTDKKGSLEKLF